MNVHHSDETWDMVAKSRVECTSAVTISGYVEIQKKSSAGKWYKYKRTNVSPFVTKPGNVYTRQAATHCAKGTFRNKTVVRAVYDGEAKNTTSYSKVTKDPCEKEK